MWPLLVVKYHLTSPYWRLDVAWSRLRIINQNTLIQQSPNNHYTWFHSSDGVYSHTYIFYKIWNLVNMTFRMTAKKYILILHTWLDLWKRHTSNSETLKRHHEREKLWNKFSRARIKFSQKVLQGINFQGINFQGKFGEQISSDHSYKPVLQCVTNRLLFMGIL